MKIILFSCFVLLLSSCKNTRHLAGSLARYKHQISDQCCTSSGGYLCGRKIKSCCKSGCESYWYGIYCKNKQSFQPECPQYCLKACENKGGIACGVILANGQISCCPSRYCTEPKQGGMTQTIISNVVRVATLLHQQQSKPGIKDRLLQKMIGKNNVCDSRAVIDLGRCKMDSRTDLLKARIFG